MNDKERFLFLLKNKEKYKVFIDNDDVYFIDKKDLELEKKDPEYDYNFFDFKEYGYHLLNEIFQAMGIDSELI